MFLLITIIIAACLVVAGATISVLYKTAIEEERSRLMETAQSQARLIEAVARFDAIYSTNYPGGSRPATLSQIIDAHEHYMGFGETGEFTLSEKNEKNIVFLLNHRHYDLNKPKPVPFESKLAEPMRRALLGQSGTVIGLDYRGEMVLAAYEPVAELNLGIVAKIDMSEVRAPFVKSGLIGVFFTILVVLIGTSFFIRITNPMIRQLEKRTLELGKLNEEMKVEINERKVVEEALLNSREKYRGLFNSIRDAILVADINRNIIDFNPAFSALFGYTIKDLKGKQTVYVYENEEQFNELGKALEKNFGKTDFLITVNYEKKTGEVFPGETGVYYLKDSGNNVTGFIGLIRDITARKQAEEALRKAHNELERRVKERTSELMKANQQLKTEIKERKQVQGRLREAEFQYRTVADFTYDWEYWSNLDGTLRYVSPSCKRISGYEPDQFINNPSLSQKIVVPEDKEIWNKHNHDSQSGLKPREIQFRIRRVDGKIRWIEHACQPVTDNQGKILGFRASNRDITMRKQLEIEAQRHREELAHLVRVATMGELSAALAHELNQPLTAILSNAQAAQRFLDSKPPDYDEVRDILADIVAEDKRAGQIIQRLGLLMKKDEVRLELLNINEVIREAAALVHSDIVILNISMSMDLNEELPIVNVDRVQLQQVILNFILNASESMKDRDPDSRQLVIITGKGESDTIIVSVKDSGKGIVKENFEKLFEPFYTTKYGGMGMGLPINKRIIEAHGGRLWAENNPDSGVTFYFTLPTGNGGKA
jgi:PAS domain S-box-containing protein